MADEKKADSCCICLVEYKDSDERLKTPCCHEFHADCLRTWFRQKQTCPLCRRDIKDVLENDLDEGARSVYLEYASSHDLHIEKAKAILELGAHGLEHMFDALGVDKKVIDLTGLGDTIGRRLEQEQLGVLDHINGNAPSHMVLLKFLGAVMETAVSNKIIEKRRVNR